MKILIICSNLIGDTVLSTGVFSYFQKKHPISSITFIIGPTAKPLLKNLQNVESLITINKKKYNLHWLEILNKTKKINWDIIIDLRSSFLSYFLRNKEKYIFKKTKNIHHVLQLSKSLGIDCSDLKIKTNEAEEKRARNYLQSNYKYLVVFPGGNWNPKIWSAENYNQLLIRLNKINKKIIFILVGSSKERFLYLHKISNQIPKENFIDLFGETLTQTAAFMKKSDLFIGNDSGLMHLSSACNLKTIALFGPTNDKIYRPWGEKNIVIRTKENFDFFNKLNINSDKTYMNSISIDKVYNEILKTNSLND